MTEAISFNSKEMSCTQDHLNTKQHCYSVNHDVQLSPHLKM